MIKKILSAVAILLITYMVFVGLLWIIKLFPILPYMTVIIYIMLKLSDMAQNIWDKINE
jgi:hypothetical protein